MPGFFPAILVFMKHLLIFGAVLVSFVALNIIIPVTGTEDALDKAYTNILNVKIRLRKLRGRLSNILDLDHDEKD